MQKIIFFFLLLFASTSFSQIMVSDSSKISLITCSPGKAVYEQFGHTAIRFQDVTTHTDLMFNYGTFNFNIPNFYGRFIKGETDYELGVYYSEYFFPEYERRNSQVEEQELNLSKEEKQKLIDALMLNNQPQNREYRYNFIFDNCATRPRIKIEETLKPAKLIYSQDITEYNSFRRWIGKYVGFHTWTKFGIDLLLGKEADKVATKMEATFLPDKLNEEFKEAQIKSGNDEFRPLIKSEKILVERIPEIPFQHTFLASPVIVTLFILLLGLIFTYIEFVKNRNWFIFDSLLLILTGVTGIIVFYLMFFSLHPLVKNNFNILWVNPVNIFIGIILWIKSWNKTAFYFQIANIFLFAGAFIVFIFSIQNINAASVPLILLLMVRAVFWIYKQRGIIAFKK